MIVNFENTKEKTFNGEDLEYTCQELFKQNTDVPTSKSESPWTKL